MQSSCHRGLRVRGFTLVEVLVVVTIVAISAAIAIPNYTAYVSRSYRSDARGKLLEAATWMQRRYTESSPPAYPTGTLPTALAQSPYPGTARYNLSIATGSSATAYSLEAAPTGNMSSDECGTFTVDNFGTKGLTVGGTAQATTSSLFVNCWNQ
jgi:type IV pilus assembly protein PilE